MSPLLRSTGKRIDDRFDLIVLLAFAAVSLWTLGLDVWQVVAHGRVWTGTDGILPEDQMQYLAWVRAVSQHGLASNLFVLRSTPADYLQPMIEISGGITALGFAPWLALLLWKPVAVGVCFFAVRAFVRRQISGRGARRAVLVLALFYGFFGLRPDLWLPFWTWGYPFELVALAAMLGALLSYDRAHAARRRTWVAPLLALLTSALHPWQGETLIVIVIVAEALTWRDRGAGQRTLALAAWTVSAAAAPLIYYAILDHVDLSWKLAQVASRGHASLPRLVLSVLPLALPGVLAYRRRSASFLTAATCTWPLAALGVFLASETRFGATPLHALAAISVPLAVLAVQGVQRTGHGRRPCSSESRFPGAKCERSDPGRGRVPWRPVLGALVVVALTVPVTVSELHSAAALVAPTRGNANFITRDERDVLAFVARYRQPGGVITDFYLGAIVPAVTGRRTFVGNCYWSQPDCAKRALMTAELFRGTLAPRAARSFVRSSGARLLLADCQTRADLPLVLGGLIRLVRRSGCASVWAIAGP